MKKRLQNDNQLRTALYILRGLAITSQEKLVINTEKQEDKKK
jgi:hypothetical protein